MNMKNFRQRISLKARPFVLLFVTALTWLCGQTANAITLTSLDGSDINGSEGCKKLFDGRQETKWGTYDGQDGTLPWTTFKASFPIAPAGYELIIANDTPTNPGRNWKKWKIYAGNFGSDAAAAKDAEGWVLIDQKDENLPTGEGNNTYEVVTLSMSEPATTCYSYFKIVVEEIVGDWQDDYCQMAEFRFTDFSLSSSATVLIDFDYTTGVDADLAAAYGEKRESLSAAVTAHDSVLIAAAIDTISPIYQEINLLRTGGFLVLDWTASWYDSPGSQLVDKNEATKWGGTFPNNGEHVQYVVFRSQALQPSFYRLVTGNDAERWNGRNWKSWKIFGGNFASEAEATRNAEGWVLLDQRDSVGEDYLPDKNNCSVVFDVTGNVSTAYSFFKVEVTASGGNEQQMSEMYLCSEDEFEAVRKPFVDGLAAFAASLESLTVEPDKEAEKATFAEKYEELNTTVSADRLMLAYYELVALKEVLVESAAFVAGAYRCIAGNTGSNDGENWTKLADGNEQTKWFGTMPDDGSYVILKAYNALTFSTYQLVTANDTYVNPERNWKNWEIYGANFDSDEEATRDANGWVKIDAKNDIGHDRLPAADSAPAYFDFSERWPDAYKYFKIEVSAAYGGDEIQMSEFRFLTDEQFAAIRAEYVDSLNKMKREVDAKVGGISSAVLDIVNEKIAAVESAEANNLLSSFAAARSYIAAILGYIDVINSGLTLLTGTDAFTVTSGTGYHDEGEDGREGCTRLLDGLYSPEIFTKWCVTDQDDCFVEFHTAMPIIPKAYVLITGNDNERFNDRNPRQWTVKAKLNESDDWTVIADVSNDNTLEDKNLMPYSFSFDNANNEIYKYFRIDITVPEDGVMQLSEMQIWKAPTLELVNEANNASIIRNLDNKTQNVILADRTLYANSTWQTLCLPFTLSSLTDTPLDRFTVMELDTVSGKYEHTTGFDNGTLYLNFKEATTIEAGKPYIVKKLAITDEAYKPAYKAIRGTAGMDSYLDFNYYNLIDGGTSNRWRTNYSSGDTVYCEFKSDVLVNATGYTLTTGNIGTAFDPKVWTLQAKMNESDEWTIIDSRNTGNSGDALPSKRTEAKYYAIQQPGTYRYFRFEVTQNGGGNQMCLTGLAMQAKCVPEPAIITKPMFSNVVIRGSVPTAVISSDERVNFVGSYSNFTASVKVGLGLPGDVNRDGEINAADLTALTDSLLAKPTTAVAPDVNGDKAVDIADGSVLVGILIKGTTEAPTVTGIVSNVEGINLGIVSAASTE